MNRALFRESALAHYERWGGEPAGGRRGGGSLSKRWWRAVVAAVLVCLAVLGVFVGLARVPVFVAVPVVLVGADGAGPARIVAVFPERAAGRVRRGTTVRVPAADGTGVVEVAVSGSGPVVTAAQVVAVFPALAGAAGLPARGVLAEGDGLPVPAGRASGAGGGSVVLSAEGRVGDRRLIGFVGSAGP